MFRTNAITEESKNNKLEGAPAHRRRHSDPAVYLHMEQQNKVAPKILPASHSPQTTAASSTLQIQSSLHFSAFTRIQVSKATANTANTPTQPAKPQLLMKRGHAQLEIQTANTPNQRRQFQPISINDSQNLMSPVSGTAYSSPILNQLNDKSTSPVSTGRSIFMPMLTSMLNSDYPSETEKHDFIRGFYCSLAPELRPFFAREFQSMLSASSPSSDKTQEVELMSPLEYDQNSSETFSPSPLSSTQHYN